ncbi:hypothetical protein GCM10009813_25480 [Brevibacterium marinum]
MRDPGIIDKHRYRLVSDRIDDGLDAGALREVSDDRLDLDVGKVTGKLGESFLSAPHDDQRCSSPRETSGILSSDA